MTVKGVELENRIAEARSQGILDMATRVCAHCALSLSLSAFQPDPAGGKFLWQRLHC